MPVGTLDLLHVLGMRRSELVARHAQDERGDYTLVAWCGTWCGALKCFLKKKNISSRVKINKITPTSGKDFSFRFIDS